MKAVQRCTTVTVKLKLRRIPMTKLKLGSRLPGCPQRPKLYLALAPLGGQRSCQGATPRRVHSCDALEANYRDPWRVEVAVVGANLHLCCSLLCATPMPTRTPSLTACFLQLQLQLRDLGQGQHLSSRSNRCFIGAGLCFRVHVLSNSLNRSG